MKPLYILKLTMLLFVLSGLNANVFAQTTYSTGTSTYTVPPGVTSLAINMYGAAGGRASSGSLGGNGGQVICTLAVAGGNVLTINVGAVGANNASPSAGGKNGSPDAGGGGGNGNGNGGGGGGSSDIRLNGTGLANRVIVAAGGGGAGYNCSGTGEWGGYGGGLTGQTGAQCSGAQSTCVCGTGGTQTAGGANGGNCTQYFTAGLGAGASGNSTNYTGGGGGGYYGGGCGYYGGGGGGSSWANPTYCTSIINNAGYSAATGNGQIVITVLCVAPGTISGTTTLCAGATSTLSESTPGGTWTSNTPAVATIDQNTGLLTGISSGTSVITYVLGSPCGPLTTATVTVKASPAPTFTGYSGAICSDVTAQLSNSVAGGTWTTSDAGVAPINSSGLITPAASGVATISYTLSSGCYATLPVLINLAPKPITGNNFLCTGAANAVLLSDVVPGGVWSSSNASASVNSTSGLVTGIATGTPFITYKIPSGGCFVTFAMNVNVQPAVITGVPKLCVGGSVSLNNVSPGGTWTSSNPYQASVTPGAGFVSGMAIGNPVISYTLPGGCSSVITATVNPVPNPLLMSSAPKVCVGQMVNVTSAELSGLWSSSNTSVATVDANTGDITGIAGGTAGIAYTFTATGCSTTLNATVNILPTVFTVGGGGGYCQGGTGMHVTLSNSELGASYELFNDGTGIPVGTQSGTASSLDFGAWSPAAVTTYTVVATSPAGCKQDMSGAAVITVNPLPVAYDLLFTGLSAYCSGGTGVHLKLNNSQVGVNYRTNNAGVLGPVVPGTGPGALDLGLYTAGTYFVEATDGVTGCKNTMNYILTVTANSLPTVYPVISTSPSTAYCAGGAGVDVSLPNSEAGITYTLMRNSVFVTAVTAVSPGALPFGGNQKVAGNYTIIAVDSSAGCSSNMSGSVNVSVNPLPVIQTVSGGGDYCLGSGGKHINLLNSAGGVKYILKDGFGTSVDSAIGSNSGLDFGAKTVGGTYTVIAVDALGCQNTMSGNAVITPKGLPNQYSVIGGGPFCSGDTGVHVKLFGYDLGVRYQLYRNGVSVGSQKTGLGSGVDFGLYTIPGNYTVVALNPATTCTNNMSNPVTVSINPLPDVHTVLGGGAFCAGDPNGVCVKLIPGDAGIDYTIYGNGLAQDTKTGTGDTLYFCNITIPGTYTIIAVNSSTTCKRNMTGSTIVKVNALPVNYKVTGGGDYCAGGPGLPIGDSLSASGVEYTLLESGNPVGPVLGGTGTALNFGLFGQGTYTIRARNLVTNCTNTGSSASIVMHALPAVHNVSGTAVFCAGDSRNITLDNSDTTASYQLYNGTSMSGPAMAGVNGSLDFGPKTTSGRYTVIAMDTANHCTNAMNDTAVLSVNPIPADFAVTLAAASRCAFDTPGIRMDLHGSELATNYQVFYGGSPDGFFAGTGLPIFLGYHKGAGSYTVVATNPVTGCTKTMTDVTNISIRSTTPTADSIYIVGGSDVVCSGLPVTLKSVPTNPGTAPVYVWKINGSVAGSDTMLTYIPSPGDVVTAIMKSNADCAFPASATSKPVALDVQLSALPTATVTATAVSPVCPGTKITFTASANFEGTDPHYGWIMNGIPVGTDSKTFSVTPTDSMVVFVQLMSSYTCRKADYVLSNDMPYAINEPVLPILSIDALTPATINKGEAVTLRAVVANRGKTAFTYQWYVHGVAQTGETNPTFTHNYFIDNEDVKVVVTSHNTCGDLSTSQSILISVRGNAGVQPVSTGGDVRVVPNPSKGTFTVKGNLGNTADEEVTLELTNMLGQVVYSSKAMSHGGNINEQVQLNGNIASGMYILNLRSGSNHEVFHVVIEQ